MSPTSNAPLQHPALRRFLVRMRAPIVVLAVLALAR